MEKKKIDPVVLFHHASSYTSSVKPVPNDTVIISLKWKREYKLPLRHTAKTNCLRQRVNMSTVHVGVEHVFVWKEVKNKEGVSD